jgi:hypothetical protein
MRPAFGKKLNESTAFMKIMGESVMPAYPDYRSFSDKPVSIRYNNPGAMWPGPSSRKFGALKHANLNDGLNQGNKAAIFPTAVHGAAALFDLYDRVYANQTLEEAINRWSGSNHVDSYLKVFGQHARLDPDDVIKRSDIRNPKFGIRFAKAMSLHETGFEYPLDDKMWWEAHEMAFPRAEVPKPTEGLKKVAKESPIALWTIIGSISVWFLRQFDAVVEIFVAAPAEMLKLAPMKALMSEATGNAHLIFLLVFAIAVAAAAKKYFTPKIRPDED